MCLSALAFRDFQRSFQNKKLWLALEMIHPSKLDSFLMFESDKKEGQIEARADTALLALCTGLKGSGKFCVGGRDLLVPLCSTDLCEQLTWTLLRSPEKVRD